MTRRPRRNHSPAFKAKVALAHLRVWASRGGHGDVLVLAVVRIRGSSPLNACGTDAASPHIRSPQDLSGRTMIPRARGVGLGERDPSAVRHVAANQYNGPPARIRRG